nr:MAG TPA: ASCH domain protein [Caudoviricetes sp.]
MAIKPILFNTEMVRAIMDGRKSCTRRLVKFLSGENPRWTGYIKDGLMLYNGKNEPCIRKAPYQPGDLLYVRETWCKGYLMNAKERYYYKADDNDFLCTWHPSTNMPKQAARIWLRVMDVRVERLQEITAESALTEGADKYIHANGTLNEDQTITSFIGIWNSTIKKSDIDRYGWGANPWVWVIEFERCEKPEGV